MIRSHARESTIAGTAHRKHALLASAAPTPAEPETATARAGHSPRPRYSGICLSPSRGAARDKAIALPFAGWRLLCLGEITNFAAIRRLVGAPRADQLIEDPVAPVPIRIDEAHAVPVGRTRLEVTVDVRSEERRVGKGGGR